MAMSDMSTSSTPRHLLLHLVLLLLCNHGLGGGASAFSFSFDFSNSSTLSRLGDLKTDGDAVFHGSLYDLTLNEYKAGINFSVGRVAYAHPVPLRNNATGEAASFTTAFSFTIKVTDPGNKGDGMAFFLAPYPQALALPPDSRGGAMGLCSGICNATSVGEAGRFVAVEFDTFNNTWDPSLTYDHIGIDVSSLASVANLSLASFSLNGQMSARVDYNSSTAVMSVEVRFDHSPKYGAATPTYNMSAKVDLSKALPEQVAVGFSAATGSSVELHQLLSWSFSLVTPGSSPANTDTAGASSKSHIGLLAGLVITCTVSVFLCILVLALRRSLRKRNLVLEKEEEESEEACMARNKLMDDEFKKGSGPRRFGYDELAAATRGFSEEEKLGEGGFGSVYRGFLMEPRLHVAIKRVSRCSEQGWKEYRSEVKIISRLRHRNLVKLIGWCHEGRELLLVYELVPKGSLDAHLYSPSILLTWPVRFKIVLGMGSALIYLHEEWEQCVVHRDIKPSNVMLDASFGAKLGDFGLARFVNHDRGSHTTNLAGTMGYMDVDSLVTGRASPESDIYSFGIVLLEIACGRKPVVAPLDEDQQSKVRLVEWAWELYGRGAVLEAADERLRGDFDTDEMERVMVVGLACAHPDCKLRPSIRQAMSMLQSEAPLPILPTKMPMLKYM